MQHLRGKVALVTSQSERTRQAGIFVSLFVVGMLVFFVGGYWAGIPYWSRTGAKIALPCLLLLATVTCSRTGSSSQWRHVWLAFFAASFAFLVAWWVSSPLMKLFGFTTISVPGIALMKLFDAIPIVVTVVLVARLGGLKPADLYLQTGKLKAWLIVGLLSFAAFAVLFLVQARDQDMPAVRLLAYAPWTLLFVFSNAFMEELHFRIKQTIFIEPANGRKRFAQLCHPQIDIDEIDRLHAYVFQYLTNRQSVSATEHQYFARC